MRLIVLIICLTTSIVKAGTIFAPEAARSVALGGAGITLSDDGSVQQNCASLAVIKNPSAALNYENKFLVQALDLKSFSLGLPTKKMGNFGLALNHFGYHLYNQKRIGIAYAKSFGKAFNAGMQFNYFSTYIAENTNQEQEFTLDLGLQTQITRQLFMAAVIINPIRTWKSQVDDKVQTLMKLGLAFHFSEKVQIVTEIEKNILTNATLKAGLEYNIIQELSLRAGISNIKSVSAESNFSIPSFGTGLHLKKISIDIASTFHPALGVSSSIGLLYHF